MKKLLSIFILGFVLSCEKENINVLTPPSQAIVSDYFVSSEKANSIATSIPKNKITNLLVADLNQSGVNNRIVRNQITINEEDANVNLKSAKTSSKPAFFLCV